MNKRIASIYQQHFFLTAGMILLAFAMLGASFMVLTYRYAIGEKKDSMNSSATYIANIVGIFLEDGRDLGDKQLAENLVYVTSVPDVDVLVCQSSGIVIYSYDGDQSGDELKSDTVSQSVLEETLGGDSGYQGMSDLGVYSASKFAVGAPVVVQDQLAGYVFVTSSTENLTSLWRTFGILYIIAAAVVLLLAFFSSFFTTRRQSRPLQEMTDVVNRFGMGEYDLRVKDYHRRDEIGQLATAFNTMADSIASAEERRQEFVANISHELKTPMTTIAGFSDGILDGTIPPEKQRESLQVISDETRRLSRLVRRMLDMSQLSAKGQGDICQSQFNIVETFAQVLISLERKITSRGLDVDVNFPDQDVMVWGDPDSITQVCYNLMDNAIKFATPGTAIGVSIFPRGNKAWISVRNTGETIPPEELGMVFDRFHKSDRSRSLDKEGVGLGLYIVKTILNNHKESITVTSENGVTEFKFTLTLAE
ncbi:MAG: HAMP domain-containing histidine kinase [Clostridiales bacterium]|nr:HAMP domain-containing histidine kinase [Clostridiales bacterium]